MCRLYNNEHLQGTIHVNYFQQRHLRGVCFEHGLELELELEKTLAKVAYLFGIETRMEFFFYFN